MEQVALVVGEALVDVVPERRGGAREHPGGSAANAAVALARLGRPVWLATAWGDDRRGRLLAAHLADNGVALAGDPLVLERTATAVATVAPDGAAAYDFDITWRLPDLDAVSLPAPAVVMCGSLGAVLEPGADAVHTLVARLRGRALTTCDVNARPALTGAGPEVVERVEAVTGLVDVVKASDEDLAALWPALAEPDAVERFLALGAAAVVVTRGPAGASWFGPRGRVDAPAPAVVVADTIAAGDTLMAAVVDGLWRHGAAGPDAAERLRELRPEECREVLGRAVAAAAVTVSRPGADPPRRHELG